VQPRRINVHAAMRDPVNAALFAGSVRLSQARYDVCDDRVCVCVSCKFAHIALLAHCVSQFRKKKELISPFLALYSRRWTYCSMCSKASVINYFHVISDVSSMSVCFIGENDLQIRFRKIHTYEIN